MPVAQKLYSTFDLTPVAQKLYSSVVSASVWMMPSQVSINTCSLIMDAARAAFAAAARWCARRTEVTHCSYLLPVHFRRVSTNFWKRLWLRINSSSGPCSYNSLTCSPNSSISNCFLGWSILWMMWLRYCHMSHAMSQSLLLMVMVHRLPVALFPIDSRDFCCASIHLI